MKYLKTSFLLIAIGCTTWGKPVLYDPNFMAHDYMTMSMSDRDNKTISCGDVEFNNYASLSKEKIKELASIIKAARLPKEMEQYRAKLLSDISVILK